MYKQHYVIKKQTESCVQQLKTSWKISLLFIHEEKKRKDKNLPVECV